jgi:hypothetical protein
MKSAVVRDKFKVIYLSESDSACYVDERFLRHHEDDLYMSKLTTLAISLLGAIALLPASQAMAATGSPESAINQPVGDLHAQVILRVGPGRDRGYYSNWEADRYRRRLEWQREREARARWGRGYYYPRDRYYRPSDRGYDRDYRYDR